MFSFRDLVAVPLLSALLLALPGWAAPGYRVTALPANFAPVDINDAGVIAGNVTVADTVSHAAVLINGRVVDLGTFGGLRSAAFAINEAGQITGTADTRDPDTSHAFLYSGSRATTKSPAPSASPCTSAACSPTSASSAAVP